MSNIEEKKSVDVDLIKHRETLLEGSRQRVSSSNRKYYFWLCFYFHDEISVWFSRHLYFWTTDMRKERDTSDKIFSWFKWDLGYSFFHLCVSWELIPIIDKRVFLKVAKKKGLGSIDSDML